MQRHIIAFSLILAASCGVTLQAEEWGSDLKAAKQEATKGKLPIVMDFTGSDWCGWCKKLKKEVFDTAEFKTWAKGKVVLMEVDFPQGKELSAAVKTQNDALQQEFKIEGFPTIVITNTAGKELGRLGYMEGGPKAWTAAADKIIATGK